MIDGTVQITISNLETCVRNVMPEERVAYAMANSRYIQITLRSPTCAEVSTLMTTITDETDLLIHPEQTKATKRQSREKS